jgi:hypothetical protein
LPEIELCVKLHQVGGGVFFQLASLAFIGFAQQSVHPTLGILARFQAFFYASAFFPVGRRSAARPSAGNANR